MRAFLDSSVLLSASGSRKGASRFIVENVGSGQATLISSQYCCEETLRNLPKLGDDALEYFTRNLRAQIEWTRDTVAMDRITHFPKAKDKPVLVSALAADCEVLLTLDRADFHQKLGRQFYGMSIRTPGEWLMEMHEQGKL